MHTMKNVSKKSFAIQNVSHLRCQNLCSFLQGVNCFLHLQFVHSTVPTGAQDPLLAIQYQLRPKLFKIIKEQILTIRASLFFAETFFV